MGSETQPDILVAAFGTSADLSAGRCRVQGIAADAVKHRLASFELEAPMVAAIVIKPQPEEYCTHQDAVNNDGCGGFEHCQHHMQ